MYGPGVLLGWILSCYGVGIVWLRRIKYATASNRNQPTDNIKLDFLSILIYPVVASEDLLLRLKNYPGPKAEIWADLKQSYSEPKEYHPYAMAINTSVWVCMTSFAINLCLIPVAMASANPIPNDDIDPNHIRTPHVPKKRVSSLGMVKCG